MSPGASTSSPVDLKAVWDALIDFQWQHKWAYNRKEKVIDLPELFDGQDILCTTINSEWCFLPQWPRLAWNLITMCLPTLYPILYKSGWVKLFAIVLLLESGRGVWDGKMPFCLIWPYVRCILHSRWAVLGSLLSLRMTKYLWIWRGYKVWYKCLVYLGL